MTEPQRRPRVAPPVRKLSTHQIAAIALGVLIAGLLLFLVTRGGGKQDKLGDDEVAGNVAVDDPESRCSAQSTYDRIKRELFKRAAALRASDQAAYDKLVAYAVLRVETPMLRGYDQRLNSASCSAFLSLDLPPGVAVAGGRRTLSADVSYTLQPAADGSGEVLTLTEADGIITPLATLARTDGPAEQPAGGAIAETAPLGSDVSGTDAPVEVRPAAPPEPPARTEPVRARPSFNCDDATTRGEIAVCENPDLAALDRTMAAQYRRAVAGASPAQRAALVQTRDRFLGYRDRCQTTGCMRDAYVGRMQEIRDIVEGRWRPR